MEKIEDIILRHGQRGMDILRKHLPADYCTRAAEAILCQPEREHVFIATGFYVAGHAETDGPSGSFYLARALRRLGYQPVIVTDLHCCGYFERCGFPVVYLSFQADEGSLREIYSRYMPCCMISVERCGKNTNGVRANCRGVDISERTAPIDELFAYLREKIPTIGIGDGGNEVGMGTLKKVISENLSITPCAIAADHLIVSTTSNWGALGLCAALQKVSGQTLLPTDEDIQSSYQLAYDLNFVDGELKKRSVSVDSFPIEYELELAEALRSL